MIKSKTYNNKHDIEKVIDGIIENASIVAKTYGYSGHDICIKYNNQNIITNDGVSVANYIYFDDKLKDIGSGLIRGITLNSDLSSNDGTTASAIIAKDIMISLKPYLLTNKSKKISNILDVKKGINLAFDDVKNTLLESKINLNIENNTDLYNVAYTSTRDEKLSKTLSEAFTKIGKDGRVLYKEHDGNDVDIEYKTGFNLDYGYETTMLPNVSTTPHILIFDERINSKEVIVKVSTLLMNAKQTNLVIFAKGGIADVVMQQIIQLQQSTQINLNISAVKIEGSDKRTTRLMKDLSIITNATIMNNSNINNITLDNLGKAKNINISEKSTTIVDGDKNIDKYDKLLDELQVALDNNRSDEDINSIQKRIANLKGLVAIIKIGGLSRERINNYKDKIKDAVGSMKNAIDKGIVPGGGIALLNSYKKLRYNESNTIKINNLNKDEMIGYNLVINSLLAPVKQILNNSYENNKKTYKQIVNNNKYNIGYDSKTRMIINDVFSKGIIDPYITIVNSLENAIDLCSLFVNLDGFIIVDNEVME